MQGQEPIAVTQVRKGFQGDGSARRKGEFKGDSEEAVASPPPCSSIPAFPSWPRIPLERALELHQHHWLLTFAHKPF